MLLGSIRGHDTNPDILYAKVPKNSPSGAPPYLERRSRIMFSMFRK